MEKTILAGSNAILSDIKVDIVDWAVNVTELSMDNHLYRNLIFLRKFETITPTSFDFMAGTKELSYIIEKYKTQALLYATSYWGNMIIHIDQIKHLTKTISIETPYRDKYDVKLDVSKDYDGCIRYVLNYKENWYSSIFTDFNLSAVSAKEYLLCKEFSYHIDPLPNEPIVLRNRNSNRETEIFTKGENETWEEFIYNYCSPSQFDRDKDTMLEIVRTESPRYYNLFLSPKNYHELMVEHHKRYLYSGKNLNHYRHIDFIEYDTKTNVPYVKNMDVDVTIYVNPFYKE